jgi:predicted Zn-dependent peptidase
VQCGVDQESVEECVKESLEILRDLTVNNLKEEEVRRAKAYGIGQALQDMESTLSYMLFVGDKLLSEERDFSTLYYCEKLKAVTVQEVKEAAEKIFKSSLLNLALIGPYNRKDELLKSLVF